MSSQLGRPFRARSRRALLSARNAAGSLIIAGCATHAPAADPPATTPVLEPFPHDQAWVAREGVALCPVATDASCRTRLFQKVDVLGQDSLGLVIRCETCAPATRARLDEQDIVHTPLPPDSAATGSLAEFALAVRDAARRRDLTALHPVMATDFSFDFIGPQTPEAAFAVWRSQDFARLDQVPELLDEGLASAGHGIWAAPPAFVDDDSYRDLRVGFRMNEQGRWEWLYLIRGITAADGD
ncbi:MAG: hypothetical protein WD737_06825 [Gemmatimonadota bacterium]